MSRDYGDAEARQIIARAAEIQREERGQLDETALRAMAADAGISPSAVDRALREHETMTPARAPWQKRYGSAIIVAAIIVAALLLMILRDVPAPRF